MLHSDQEDIFDLKEFIHMMLMKKTYPHHIFAQVAHIDYLGVVLQLVLVSVLKDFIDQRDQQTQSLHHLDTLLQQLVLSVLLLDILDTSLWRNNQLRDQDVQMVSNEKVQVHHGLLFVLQETTDLHQSLTLAHYAQSVLSQLIEVLKIFQSVSHVLKAEFVHQLA